MKAFVKLGLKLYLKLCIILELKGVETLLKMHKHQCRVDLVSGQQIFPPAFYWVHLRSSESNPALMCSLTCLKMLTCTTFFRLGTLFSLECSYFVLCTYQIVTEVIKHWTYWATQITITTVSSRGWYWCLMCGSTPCRKKWLFPVFLWEVETAWRDQRSEGKSLWHSVIKAQDN